MCDEGLSPVRKKLCTSGLLDPSLSSLPKSLFLTLSQRPVVEAGEIELRTILDSTSRPNTHIART